MEKKSNEEIRQEVLKDDASRDVNMNIAVFVAAVAMLSSGAATLAVLAVYFLSNFRQDVENMWSACIPLCFTFITGVAVAYRKQMADVGIHIALVMTTLLTGGAGYGLSIEPVYFNRENCTTPADYNGDCNKEVLTTVYFIAGAVASGFAVIGFLASLCACSNAMSRRSRRAHYEHMRLQYEENREKREDIENKRKQFQPPKMQSLPPPPPTIITTTPTKPTPPPTVNGTPAHQPPPPPTMTGNGIGNVPSSHPAYTSVATSTECPPPPMTEPSEVKEPPKIETETSLPESEPKRADQATQVDLEWLGSPPPAECKVRIEREGGDKGKVEQGENDATSKVMTHL